MILCFLYCQGRLATNFEPIEIDEQDLLEQLVFIHMLAFVQKHGSNVDCGESFAVMLEKGKNIVQSIVIQLTDILDLFHLADLLEFYLAYLRIYDFKELFLLDLDPFVQRTQFLDMIN
jgi:hypothetical protein